jgi:hypothetical protein
VSSGKGGISGQTLLAEAEFSDRLGRRPAMGMKARPSFVKRQRERDQKERRKLKEERRMKRKAGIEPGSEAAPSQPIDTSSLEVVPAVKPAPSSMGPQPVSVPH